MEGIKGKHGQGESTPGVGKESTGTGWDRKKEKREIPVREKEEISRETEFERMRSCCLPLVTVWRITASEALVLPVCCCHSTKVHAYVLASQLGR